MKYVLQAIAFLVFAVAWYAFIGQLVFGNVSEFFFSILAFVPVVVAISIAVGNKIIELAGEIREYDASALRLGLGIWQRSDDLLLPALIDYPIPSGGVDLYLGGRWKGRMIHLFRLNYLAGTDHAGPVGTTRFICQVEFPDRKFPAFNAEWTNLSRPKLFDSSFKRVDPQPTNVNQNWQLYTPSGTWPFGYRLGEWLGEARGLAYLAGDEKGCLPGFNFEGCGPWIQVHGYCRGPASFAEQDIARFLDLAIAEAEGFAAHAEEASGEPPFLLIRPFQFDPPGGYFLLKRLGAFSDQ